MTILNRRATTTLKRREKNIIRREKKQLQFFDIKPRWEKEWRGMPEFLQRDLEPTQQIIVNFRSRDDVNDFANLINQRLTEWTKSIWFPKSNKNNVKNMEYRSES